MSAGSPAKPRLLRNSLWNFAGYALPYLLAFSTIPFLVRSLGNERYGALTLLWMLVNYFAIFDIGLSRAMTWSVSDALATGASARVPLLVWTCQGLMLAFGILGGAVVFLVSPWAIGRFLHVGPGLQNEVVASSVHIALAIPAVILIAGFRGALEAHRRFGATMALRLMFALALFVLPVAVSLRTTSLPVISFAIVLGLYGCLLLSLFVCLGAIPILRTRPVFAASLLPPLIRFGGWATVSSVVSPLMTYLDRLILPGMVALASLAYYTVSYDVTGALGLISGAIIGVLFPVLSASQSVSRKDVAADFDRGSRMVLVALFPATLLLGLFGTEAMTLWIGRPFAEQAATPLRWLCLGRFVNGLAQAPFSLVHAVGRPDATAKLHLVELPLYAALIIFLVPRFGVTGAAIAWTLRVSVDACLVLFLAQRLVPATAGSILRSSSLATVAASAFLIPFFIHSLALKSVLAAAAIGAFSLAAWLLPRTGAPHA